MYWMLVAGSALANGNGQFCSATAETMFQSCGLEVRDDLAKTQAICINVEDEKERNQCKHDAEITRGEGDQLCRDQLTARRQACTALGENRYDPDFDPVDFDNNFASPTKPNRYFPLKIGNRWEYRGGTETVSLEVLNRTKLIGGIRCIVVRDVVRNEGLLIEDTDDWFAQAKDGSVWYCGEEVKDYESFKGDKPMRPELISIDGSFKAGRDGDKPGVIFLANPKKGQTYREEFSLANAEDISQVVSTTYAYGSDPELDRFVPWRLARLLCRGDCVVLKAFSPLEPGVFARKYYAPGIGNFLEVKPANGEIVQLIKCNFDSRCAALPAVRP